MAVYNEESILFVNGIVPKKLNKSIWWYPDCENDGLYAEITIQSGDILFRVDGGDPYSAHCQYGLQFCDYANSGDVIKLENFIEITGFNAVKYNQNALISVIYYKA